MTDKLAEIRERHNAIERWSGYPAVHYRGDAHNMLLEADRDRAWLLARIDLLTALMHEIAEGECSCGTADLPWTDRLLSELCDACLADGVQRGRVVLTDGRLAVLRVGLEEPGGEG